MERSELPEVQSVHVGSVSEQGLGHLAMAVGAGVVEGNQPSVRQ